MRMSLGRAAITLSLAGFLVVGLLLFTHHAGLATKFVNGLFFLLTAGVIYEKIN